MPTNRPVRYDPVFEVEHEDEAKTSRELASVMRSIAEMTCREYGRAVRTVHAKSHGILRGRLEIFNDLPESLAQGIVVPGARYAAIMRFSTNPGDILDDSVSLPRGLALKVVDVPGERLEGAEASKDQDFVMVDSPAFPAAKAADFLKTLKMLAATTDTAQGLKKAASAVFRPIEAGLERPPGRVTS